MMERETGLEPATSSLGSQTYIESKSLARFCCELLNLQHLAESAVFESVPPNEAQTRQVLHSTPDGSRRCPSQSIETTRTVRNLPICSEIRSSNRAFPAIKPRDGGQDSPAIQPASRRAAHVLKRPSTTL